MTEPAIGLVLSVAHGTIHHPFSFLQIHRRRNLVNSAGPDTEPVGSSSSLLLDEFSPHFFNFFRGTESVAKETEQGRDVHFVLSARSDHQGYRVRGPESLIDVSEFLDGPGHSFVIGG